jgi:UDP-N-acetylglucosamine--N-acetylmuramyl-(pentapeptide) pyrophosphoryl-undecaprenol N-acetylglucosamine transferase
MAKYKKILIAAGGTGGHLSPAIALAEQLDNLGFNLELITDQRCQNYLPIERKYKIKIYNHLQFSQHPLKFLQFIFSLSFNILQIIKKIKRENIELIISFGGYTALSSNIAAIFTIKKLILHEQNSHAGRVNKIFARFADKIITTYPNVSAFDNYKDKLFLCDLPIRNIFVHNHIKTNKKFNILIMGGSQGAQIFSKIFSELFNKNLIKNVKKIKIIQQVREEERESLEKLYKNLGISYEIKTYFTNISQKLSETDLVISRAGAATIAEIIFTEKPAILIPYPYAKDNHQFYNAKYLESFKACYLFQEKDLDIRNLSKLIDNLIDKKNLLADVKKNIISYKKKQKYYNFISLIKDSLDSV